MKDDLLRMLTPNFLTVKFIKTFKCTQRTFLKNVKFGHEVHLNIPKI